MSDVMQDEDVARLTRPERETRNLMLTSEALRIVDEAIDEHVSSQNKMLAAVCVLFSGGNDSTVLAHLFRASATHAIHANTTIGLEPTREFVRNTCEEWGLPLIEKLPPREEDHYEAQVLLHGFPGPGRHAVMFQRLKERGLRAARKDLIGNRGRKERVLYVAGRRRAESSRRASIPANGIDGAIVWSAPLLNWTKPDLLTYRLMHKVDASGICPRCGCGGVPVNETAQLIHMSGECLCGAFASPGEREQLEYWFYEHLDLIRWLEAELLKPEYDHIPAYRKTWGWGAIPELLAQAPGRERKPKSAGLCDSCNPEIRGLFDLGAIA